jgi:hypothetical protein
MQLIGAGEIIKRSWNLYWGNFQLLIAIAAWTLVPAVAMTLLTLMPESFWAATTILSMAVGVGTIIVGLWVYIALTEVVIKQYKKEKFNTQVIYKSAWSKIIPLLWVSILSGLAVFGGTLLLIIPGIIFAVWFAFSSIINVIEGTRGSAALKESKRLVSGRWWSVFWRLVAPYVVYILGFYVIVGVIFWLVGLATGNWEGFITGEYLPWLNALVSNAINVLVTPLFITLPIILYVELKKLLTAK